MKTGKQVIAPASIAGAALYVVSLALPMVRGAVSGNAVNHLVVSGFLAWVGCAVCCHRGRLAYVVLCGLFLTSMIGIGRLSWAHLWRFVLSADAEVHAYWALSFAAGLLFGWGAVRRERQDQQSGDGGARGG